MGLFNALVTANSALQFVESLLAQDTFALFDKSNFQQVLSTARPMKAHIVQSSRVMEHPLESGSVVTDHRIVNPNEIEISLIVSSNNYNMIFQQITSLFYNATLLIVQANFGNYSNMFIAALPHEERPEMFDSIVISLRLREALYPNVISSYAPATPANTLLQRITNAAQSVIGYAGSIQSVVKNGLVNPIGIASTTLAANATSIISFIK